MGMREEIKCIANEQEKIHLKIIFTVFLLTIYGTVMVFSASSYICAQSSLYNYDSSYLFKRQLFFMLIGMGVILVIQFVDVTILENCAKFIYVCGYGALILLMTPFAVSSHGAKRWVRIMGIQFQPAELVKISVIIFLGYLVSRYYRSLRNVRLTLIIWGAGGIPATLLYVLSNDLSSAAVILVITFGITFITNRTEKLHLLILIGAILVVGGYVLHISNNLPSVDELNEVSFRVGRIAAWINPEKYASNQGYQTMNSLYAIANGGWWGKGLGKSVMKLGAIPEAQNDMIFSIICEELGIVGASILIYVFGYLFYLTTKTVFKAETLFESVMVLGVLIHISFQMILNIGVTLNIFPNTGISLPFISYGGTSLVCILFEMAIVVSVARKSWISKSKRIWRKHSED